jgi:hypothetical protein
MWSEVGKKRANKEKSKISDARKVTKKRATLEAQE